MDAEGTFVLITGANMSGKSTFLRTIATTMILAMTGAPVCASGFRFRPMKLFSSMRTNDSLNKHESYFYAELKRLKELLDQMRSGEKLFVILDEILKGTNSTDKQKGSKEALRQIMELNGTGIIATHDLELTKIADEYPGRIRNVCFEIDIDKAKISFDYKLRDGVTTKMNALLLMKQMGIIQS
jgi:DNA mismatch repair ATPase MutS